MADNENKFFKMVKDTATKTATAATKAAESVMKTAEDKVEIGKLNSQISDLKLENAGIFRDIGEEVYKSNKYAFERNDFKDQIGQIKANEERIVELGKRSAELRGMKICPYCKKEYSAKGGIAFCPACGGKL